MTNKVRKFFMNKQITLHFDPYAYVRVQTMKTMLLKKEDYDRLMKLSIPEIAKSLQDFGYKKEIDAIALKTITAINLEKALNQNRTESFEKIKRICEENIAILVNIYLLRYDIQNMKTIIRAKINNKSQKEIIELLQEGMFNKKIYEQLMTLTKIEDVLLALPGLPLEKRKLLSRQYHETKLLFTVENQLDKIYAAMLMEIAEKIPNEGELFQKLIIAEIDVINVKLLIRCKKENLPYQEVKSYLIPLGTITTQMNVGRIYNHDINKIIESLQRSSISAVVKEYKKLPESKRTISQIETMLSTFLIKKANLLSHQYPLSIYIILGYMLSKDIEIKNLKMIIKAKELQVNPEFLQEQLVI